MSIQYAYAICPPPDIVYQVRQYKKFLQRQLGWYPSVNSDAHLTVTSFTANSWQLAASRQFAEDYCAKRSPLPVIFNHYGAFASGAFYLAPDEHSYGMLGSVMKDFNRKLPLDALACTEPHMTIARGLDMLSLYYSRMLFTKTTPNLSFRIDGISLRRLNDARGQYDIIAHFPFGGSSATPAYDYAWQGQLF